jgi:hypothetical protein
VGYWLYSSDFALDLRGSVKAVTRLPFEPDRLLDYLCAAEPLATNNSKNSDHTIFWLTVADQFARRGVDLPPCPGPGVGHYRRWCRSGRNGGFGHGGKVAREASRDAGRPARADCPARRNRQASRRFEGSANAAARGGRRVDLSIADSRSVS